MQKIVVFIVEDDFVYSKLIADMLESLNEELAEDQLEIDFQTFYSSKEAKFELDQNPHIVLLDYFIMNDDMEPETGLNLMNAIKELNPETAVVVVSGQSDPDVAKDLLDKGALYYVSKQPESFVKLRDIVKEIALKHR